MRAGAFVRVEVTEEQRWWAALSLLHGHGDELAEHLIARRRRLMWLLVVPLMIGALGVGILVARTFPRGRAAPLPAWRSIVSTICSLLALLLLVGSLIRQRKVWPQWRRSPSWVLTRRQNVRLRMMMQGRVELESRLEPLVDAQSWWAPVGVLLLFGSQIARFRPPVPLMMAAGAALALLLAFSASRITARRARSFLQRHPERTALGEP